MGLKINKNGTKREVSVEMILLKINDKSADQRFDCRALKIQSQKNRIYIIITHTLVIQNTRKMIMTLISSM